MESFSAIRTDETASAPASAPIHGVLSGIGRTPLVELRRYPSDRIGLWAKLEFCNPGGSSKARSAARMVGDAIAAGRIRSGETVVESSSGNMGVGLAQACAHHGLRLICVVDSRANPITVKTMRALGAEVREIDDPGRGGDPLAARLELAERLVRETPGAHWLNQYSSPANPAAHAGGTMREIDEALDGRVDYLFVAVGTGGTLKGSLDYLRAQHRRTRVIAVDAVGSVLFGGSPGSRKLPGMGAARRSPIADECQPFAVERVSEPECVIACRELAREEGILAGASSGGVLAAARRYLPELDQGARCACVLADGGGAYLDTVYDDEWVIRELGLPRTALSQPNPWTTP